MESAKYLELSDKKQKLSYALAVVAGLLVGFANDFFGAGGGMLAVPALTFILGLPEKKAHATALLIILPLSIISSIIYSRSITLGAEFIPVLIGVLIGGIVGAVLLKKLSTPSIILSFYFLMAFAGLQMVLR